jgi:hypothetical protein
MNQKNNNKNKLPPPKKKKKASSILVIIHQEIHGNLKQMIKIKITIIIKEKVKRYRERQNWTNN